MFLCCFRKSKVILLWIGILSLTGFMGSFVPTCKRKIYTVHHQRLGIRSISWSLRREQLRQLNTFSVEGHLEARSYEHKRVSIAFKWEQGLGLYRLKFLDLKGYVFMEVAKDKKNVKLRIKNQTYFGKDAELLMQEHLGVPIPLSYFTDWLRGVPTLGARHERVLNPTKHLLTLNQGGWFVRYLRFHQIQAVDLPTQLCMMKEDWYLRILVSQWKL